MDAKTILNPKGWLIGVGIVNILFSIMNYMMGGDVATTALEAEYGALSDRELAVATGYEEGWGSLVFLTASWRSPRASSLPALTAPRWRLPPA